MIERQDTPGDERISLVITATGREFVEQRPNNARWAFAACLPKCQNHSARRSPALDTLISLSGIGEVSNGAPPGKKHVGLNVTGTTTRIPRAAASTTPSVPGLALFDR